MPQLSLFSSSSCISLIILRFDSGSLTPNSYFFTKMKSPTTRPGNIEPEGILYGSIINDLNIRTNASIGKSDARKLITAIASNFLENI